MSAAPPAARAAHDTDVADAMDPDHPIEVDLDVGYTHLRRDTKITRENFQSVDPNNPAAGKNIVLVDELHHSEVDDSMAFRLGVGLYHDLELHFVLPYSFGDTQNWTYAGDTTAATSTLTNNQISASGCAAPGSCSTTMPIVSVPGSSKRSGIGDPTLGIAWGPVNEEREERLKPEIFPNGHPVSTWVVGFDYTLPLPGSLDDPSKFGAPGTAAAVPGYSGSLLRKAHIFSPWTAFSIRYKVLNPYFSLRANLPLVMKGSAYDNCSDTAILADVAVNNCKDPHWIGNTGYQPSFTGEFKLGTEFVIAEDPEARQKFAFDLSGLTTWYSPGRNYSIVSDALGKLTYEDEHISTIGTFGIYGRAARWLHFRVSGSLGFDTAHFLTNESVGDDIDKNGTVGLGSVEQNPLYDFRLDQVGRRLRAEMALIWGVSGTISLNF